MNPWSKQGTLGHNINPWSNREPLVQTVNSWPKQLTFGPNN